MPELPEVQTTVDDLNRRVKGRRIIDVWLDWQKLKDVKKAGGRTIQEVRRRGKNILVYFTDGNILLIHMKMTGHLLIGRWRISGKKITPVSPKELKERINDFIHFILTLDDGRMIGFSDLRKFGKVIFGPREKIENLKELKKLGPEAIATPRAPSLSRGEAISRPSLRGSKTTEAISYTNDEDCFTRRGRVRNDGEASSLRGEAEAISFEEFSQNIKKKKKTIYQVLMDQSVVAGIGNIYANDIMFKAQIHPFKPADKLNSGELKALYKAMRFILTKALKARGTSTADYRDTAGKKGGYGDTRLIYQREGESCPRGCGGKIIRRKKGGRSAFFCPKCQLENRK